MKTAMKTVMKSLIPLLVVASAVAAVDVQKRLMNSEDCPVNEGLHYVVLVHTGSYDKFCGGNLISEEWVLTAAHCKEEVFDKFGDPDTFEEFDVLLGHHPTSLGQRMHITKNTERHFVIDNHIHDIMLFKLPKKTSHRTIALPPLDCQSPTKPFNNPYTVIGWSDNDDISGVTDPKKTVNLQCCKVDLDPHTSGRNQVITIKDNKVLRAHLLSSNSPCQSSGGDSGGSMVKDGVLVGVTVNGKKLKWTNFMDVCAYRKWIKDKAGIE